ncbi:MAG: hypothetical protein ABJE79_15945, partial [Marinomonas sp.]
MSRVLHFNNKAGRADSKYRITINGTQKRSLIITIAKEITMSTAAQTKPGFWKGMPLWKKILIG